MQLPTVLTVAGSDSSGGAGIEADLKTITAHGCYGMTCITALTAQNTCGVRSINMSPADHLRATFDALFEDVKRIDVIKTGMLTLEAVDELSAAIKKYNFSGQLVVDPVLVATSGTVLGKAAVLDAILTKLAKNATLLTPNAIEGKQILEHYKLDYNITCLEEMKRAAKDITEKCGTKATLMKGGHVLGETLTDVLFEAATGKFTVFKNKHIDTTNTHGTGCTLASAISSNLARCLPMHDAVDAAIKYVHHAIEQAPTDFSRGENGPLNHVYHILPPASQHHGVPYPGGSFYEYIINHPSVAPNWKMYTEHEFVKQIAEGTVSEAGFGYFLQQDYVYLDVYARIYAMSVVKAPTVEIAHKEAEGISNIYGEMKRHVEKCAKLGLDVTAGKKGPACEAYTKYLTKVAESGDWIDIQVAVAPCLHGYGVAAHNFKISENNKNELLLDWMQDYAGKNFDDAREAGRKILNDIGADIPASRVPSLLKMYADVSLLEYNFWTEALNYEGENLLANKK